LIADACAEICGDGMDYLWFECDDGNFVTGDGCDQFCNIEPGWTCPHGDVHHESTCYHWDKVPAIIGVTMPNANTMIVTFNTSVTVPANWIDYVDVIPIMDGPR